MSKSKTKKDAATASTETEPATPVSSTAQVNDAAKAVDLVSAFLKKVPKGKHFNVEVFSNQDGTVTFHSRTQ